MFKDGKLYLAQGETPICLLPSMANRHGLIAGATGTGKTVTMKVMAEGFSDMGVPVFFSDIKGDLSGMCRQGEAGGTAEKRANELGLSDFSYKAYPTRFWDIFGEKGHPVRVTVSDMGPALLSRILGLTDVQEGVLNIAFRIADDHQLLLIDLKDLRAMLNYTAENSKEFSLDYGNVSTASVGAILRALLQFEEEGGAGMFGEPSLDITDWMRTDIDGRGYINILESARLIQSPTVYATFLLWMMSELFEKLPEIGDPEKPRIVFFFDEAHLLFADAPKVMVQKIVQMVKLIRSKGVGIYFVTQSPADIPGDVLAQLSGRVQHALRAYTPSEQKAVKAVAGAFRENPAFDTEEKLLNLAVGEALVSFLDEKGVPSVVQAASILPPQSLMGPCGDDVLEKKVISDEFDLKYRQAVDRVSAYEILKEASEKLKSQQSEFEGDDDSETEAEPNAKAKKASSSKKKGSGDEYEKFLEAGADASKKAKKAKSTSSTAKTLAASAATLAASSVARSVSTNIVNSVLGGTVHSKETIAKRAASTALSSVLRKGSTSLVRGLFGNLK